MSHWVYSVLVILCWGIWSFGAKLLSKAASSEVGVFITFMGAASVIAGYALWGKFAEHKPLTANAMLSVQLVLLGFLLAIGFIFFYKALETGPVSTVVPLTALYILIPVAAGVLFLGEAVTVARVMGIAFAVLAIALLSR